jgi:excisionase family DNA binding protein
VSEISQDLDQAQERLRERMPTPRDQLSPREVADRTGLSYHAVLRAIRRGELAACRPVPSRLRIEISEYERWRTQPYRPAAAPERPGSRGGGKRGAGEGSYAARLRAIEGGG